MIFSNFNDLSQEEQKALLPKLAEYLDQNQLYIDLYKKLKSFMGNPLFYQDTIHEFFARHSVFLDEKLKSELEHYEKLIALYEEQLRGLQKRLDEGKARIPATTAETPRKVREDKTLEMLIATQNGLIVKNDILEQRHARLLELQANLLESIAFANKLKNAVLANVEQIEKSDREFKGLREKANKDLAEELKTKNRQVEKIKEEIAEIESQAASIDLTVRVALDMLETYKLRSDISEASKQEQRNRIELSCQQRNELQAARSEFLEQIAKLEAGFEVAKQKFEREHIPDYSILLAAYDYRDSTSNRDGVGTLCVWIKKWFAAESHIVTTDYGAITPARVEMTNMVDQTYESVSKLASGLDRVITFLTKSRLGGALSEENLNMNLRAYEGRNILFDITGKLIDVDSNGRPITNKNNKGLIIPDAFEQMLDNINKIVQVLIDRKNQLSPDDVQGNKGLFSQFFKRSTTQLNKDDETIYNKLVKEIAEWQELMRRIEQQQQFVKEIPIKALILYAETFPNMKLPGMKSTPSSKTPSPTASAGSLQNSQENPLLSTSPRSVEQAKREDSQSERLGPGVEFGLH